VPSWEGWFAGLWLQCPTRKEAREPIKGWTEVLIKCIDLTRFDAPHNYSPDLFVALSIVRRLFFSVESDTG